MLQGELGYMADKEGDIQLKTLLQMANLPPHPHCPQAGVCLSPRAGSAS